MSWLARLDAALARGGACEGSETCEGSERSEKSGPPHREAGPAQEGASFASFASFAPRVRLRPVGGPAAVARSAAARRR